MSVFNSNLYIWLYAKITKTYVIACHKHHVACFMEEIKVHLYLCPLELRLKG